MKLFSETSRDESALSSSSIPNVRMNWKQTTNTITFLYQSEINYPAANYQLTRIEDSKIEITIAFGNLEKDIVRHEFKLAGDIKWPPQWTKNHETMEVLTHLLIKLFIIFFYLCFNKIIKNFYYL